MRFATTVVLFVSTTALAAPAPHLDFRTISTECCDVHFPAALEDQGQLVASFIDECADNALQLVRGRFSQRVQVVFTDVTDAPNGFANIVPYNRVELRAITPEDDSDLSKTNEWLRLLVQHEILHIAHLDIVHGLPAVVNAVVGKVWPPNSVQPRMFVEGLAVYAETRFSDGGGRLNSTLFRAPLRVAALRGDRWSLDDVANVSRRPPGGTAAYMYGSAFVAWLTRRYGEQLWPAYAHLYGQWPIPYTVQRTFEEVTGRDLALDWRDFLDELLRDADTIKAVVDERGGPTTARRLTRSGGAMRRPAWLRDGTAVVAINPPDGPAGLYAMRGLPKAVPVLEPIVRTTDLADVTVVDDDIVYSQTEIHERWFSYRDLFVRESDGRVRQLTYGARVKNPAHMPNSRRVVAEQRTGLRSAVVVVDVDSGIINDVAVAPRGALYYTPRPSPDGAHIAVSQLGSDGRRQIVLIGRNGATTRLVYGDDEHAGDQFDPIFLDDHTVLYSEDVDGVFNVYALDLASGERRRVVDTLGNATQMTPTPDGRAVLYTDLHLDGVDLYAASLDLEHAPIVGTGRFVGGEFGSPAGRRIIADDNNVVDTHDVVTTAPMKVTPYSPWATLWPRSYTPGITGDTTTGLTLSLAVDGKDAAELVSWSLFGAIDTTYGKPNLVGTVRLTNLTFPLSATAELRPVMSDRVRQRDGQPELHIEDQLRANVSVNVPLRRRRFNHNVALGAQRVQSLHETPRTSTPDELNPRYPQSVLQPVTQAFTVDYSYSGVESYRDSVSTEWGSSMSLRLRLADRLLLSDVDIREVTFDARAFFPMPGLSNHVVATYLTGGAALDTRPGNLFFLGGFVGRSVLQDVFDGTRASSGTLRGFPIAHLAGDAMAGATVEYRLPLLEIERGIETLPVFFERVHGAVFVDTATAFLDRPGSLAFATSLGAELRANLIIGYYGSFLVRVGYARGVTQGGVDQPYAVLGIPY